MTAATRATGAGKGDNDDNSTAVVNNNKKKQRVYRKDIMVIMDDKCALHENHIMTVTMRTLRMMRMMRMMTMTRMMTRVLMNMMVMMELKYVVMINSSLFMP